MILKNVYLKEVMLIKWLSDKCRSIFLKGGKLKGKLYCCFNMLVKD